MTSAVAAANRREKMGAGPMAPYRRRLPPLTAAGREGTEDGSIQRNARERPVLRTPDADEITGHDGQDQLRGGSGNDTIGGGNGPDSPRDEVLDRFIQQAVTQPRRQPGAWHRL